jgi:hypothetical protein
MDAFVVTEVDVPWSVRAVVPDAGLDLHGYGESMFGR